MFTENLLATVLSVFSAIAAVILVIFFGKFDRFVTFSLVIGIVNPFGTSAESFDANSLA